MRVLLVKPRPEAVQFGLAPFFQTEPLGLEYIAAELKARGHRVVIVDMRFHRGSFASVLKSSDPEVLGIACLHILDAVPTMRLADEAKAFKPGLFIVAGGHAISAYPRAMDECTTIDAICVGEGERTFPMLCDALDRKRVLDKIPSLALKAGRSGFAKASAENELLDLGLVRPPDRSLVSKYQKNYCCLNYMPVWTIETTRGCPHHCSFCSVWQFYRGSCRFHKTESVSKDFAAVGENVFIIDDLFWADSTRSRDLAAELTRTGVRKNWILVQSRSDLVARKPELLERWRPLANNFDIFFGFESATTKGLDSLNKNMDVSETVEAVRVARRIGFGVTGSFIIDPEYGEEDFRALWEFIDRHRLHRAGFTILTPLPGTIFFERMRDRLEDLDWNHYDLHHLLWPSRLPVGRFFELYCESWRRSVLNLAGKKKLWNWFSGVRPRDLPRLVRILLRTQQLMNPNKYRSETMNFENSGRTWPSGDGL